MNFVAHRASLSERAPELTAWVYAAVHAAHEQDWDAAAILVEVARGKATKIEGQRDRDDSRALRNAFGPSAPQASPGPSAPTRAAYRWVQGMAGWV